MAAGILLHVRPLAAAIMIGTALAEREDALGPPLRRLLVGYDGGPASHHAALWARAIARVEHASITLLTTRPTHPANEDAVLGLAQHRGVELLLHVLEEEGIPVEARVRSGGAAACILAELEEGGYDLALLGGDEWGRRHHLGAVAAEVLDGSTRSVLLAKAAPPTERILAATDGTHDSRGAVRLALRLASAWNVPLDVVFALEGGLPADVPIGARPAHLAEFPSIDPEVRSLVVSGESAPAILDAARRQGAGLVVVGTHNVLGERDRAHFSVSRSVAFHARASVLVARDPPF